jgi:hypothetical protein
LVGRLLKACAILFTTAEVGCKRRDIRIEERGKRQAHELAPALGGNVQPCPACGHDGGQPLGPAADLAVNVLLGTN